MSRKHSVYRQLASACLKIHLLPNCSTNRVNLDVGTTPQSRLGNHVRAMFLRPMNKFPSPVIIFAAIFDGIFIGSASDVVEFSFIFDCGDFCSSILTLFMIVRRNNSMLIYVHYVAAFSRPWKFTFRHSEWQQFKLVLWKFCRRHWKCQLKVFAFTSSLGQHYGKP